MRNLWQEFNQRLYSETEGLLNKKIILYGSADEQIYSWLKEHNANIVYVIDRWNNEAHFHINHLMTLYYLDIDNPEDFVIINTLPKKLGPYESFCEIGEKWELSEAKNIEIVELWEKIYGDIAIENDSEHPCINFYDYVKIQMGGVELTRTISRKYLNGPGAHGYYPTDTRLLTSIYKNYINEDDALFDFGCGKGGALSVFYYLGVKKLGGVEYTPEIFNIAQNNFDLLGIKGINLIRDDATTLNEELDDYNTYFFFNPFAYWVFEKVFHNIIESLNRKHRKLKIIYAEPMCHKLIMQSGLFCNIAKIGHDIGGITYDAYVYETI